MEIHKPKPWHNGREFLKEVGTIVLGVCIALIAEQTVEAAHWAQMVREAKASVHHELSLASMFGDERLARLDCANARLDALAAAVVASPAQWAPPSFDYCGLHHKEVYVGNWRPWPTEVWHTIEASGAVAHFSAQYRLQAPFVFTFIGEIGALDEDESRLTAEVAPLGYPVTLTPDSRIGLLKTLAALRAVNRQMAILVRDLNGNIRELGEAPSGAERAAWRKEIPNYFVRPGVLLNIPAPPKPQP